MLCLNHSRIPVNVTLITPDSSISDYCYTIITLNIELEMNNFDDVTETDITESVDKRFYLSREASYFEMHDESSDSHDDFEIEL